MQNAQTHKPAYIYTLPKASMAPALTQVTTYSPQNTYIEHRPHWNAKSLISLSHVIIPETVTVSESGDENFLVAREELSLANHKNHSVTLASAIVPPSVTKSP